MELTKSIVQRAIDRMPFKCPYTADEWLEHMYLENYHCHKDFSNVAVTDCAEKIENYAQRIKDLGSGQCLFSGEHGSQGNWFHVYKVAEEYGLRYRHSAEAYWVKDRHEKDRTNCHIMIVAKNDEGRKDLNYILSVANEDGYYYQPRIDLELLLGVDPENFLVFSACVAGWNYEDADEIWLKIAEHFGQNFFFEVQCHDTDKQRKLNERILQLSKEYDIPIICGLDSHYVLEENKVKRELMQKERKMAFDDEESMWYLDYPDAKTVIERFEKQGVLSEDQILEAILNTSVFVSECEEIILDRHFKIPNIYKDLDYEGRVKLFKQKINKAYHDDPYKSQEKINGIRWEVEQFVESGTVDYPLMSEAIVKKAVEDYGGVITTTARGSASGFLTNNYMGLTTIDRFNADVPLYPERFLTKDRVLSGSLPDIDTNCADSEPLIKAARDLLGEHGCYPLMTLRTYKEKSAWLMYARVNGIAPEKSMAISKALDAYNKDFAHADDEDKENIRVENYIPAEYKNLYEESKTYQGITTQVGIHACGVLAFDGDIRREIGLISAKSETTGERTLVACVEGKMLDEFGYVKEDFLIVDTVSLTKEMFDSIGQPVPNFEELKHMVAADPMTWDIYAKGITCCVNQVEKAATTQKAMRYRPKNIQELASFIAAIRPGMASLVNNFLGRKPYTTGETTIDELLDSSSHYMLYQESIMTILSFLGLPMTDTYSVVKMISKKKLKGKKKEDLLLKLQAAWQKEFGNTDNFHQVWQVIEDAASYSFNACVSEDTVLQSALCMSPNMKWKAFSLKEIDEVRKMKTSIEAREAGHLWKWQKLKKKDYGYSASVGDYRKICMNKVMEIYQSGVRDLWHVETTRGCFVDCTLDHKLLTPQGERAVFELKVGDEVYIHVNGDRPATLARIDTIKSIEYLKQGMTYDVEMLTPYHNFTTRSGLVCCNCHAYAMAGDSLYLAWFKAHYPAKFYEVAISHYQEKSNKTKIDALIKEAMKFYDYKIGSYEFGADNRRINIDEENRTIYPNLSSIKGFGEKVVAQLYETSQGEFNNFQDVYSVLKTTALNSTQLTNLAKLGYFKRFGNENQILSLIGLYDFASSIKTSVSKKKLEDLSIPLAYVLPFGRETKTKIMDLQKDEFVAFLKEKINEPEPSDMQRLKWQFEVTGITDQVCPSIPSNEGIVIDVEVRKGVTNVTFYSPNKGKNLALKMYTKTYEAKKFDKGDFIRVSHVKKKVKTAFTGNILPNGKREYKPVASGETEAWLEGYVIL